MVRKGKGKGREAKRYRAILREAKEGKDLDQLLKRARGLQDPYFQALALFDLSSDQRLDQRTATSIVKEALANAGKVERLWRRAELLTTFLKKISNWGDGRPSDGVLKDIVDAITSMDTGQGLSDAITGCASRVGPEGLRPLLEKAIANKGFELKDTKAVIRSWAQDRKEKDLSVMELQNVISSIKDHVIRSKLLGYFHVQCQRSGTGLGTARPLRDAMEAVMSAGPDEKVEAFRYLAGQCSSKEDLEAIRATLVDIDDHLVRAKLLATLGGSADKAGLKELAMKWFNEGLTGTDDIEDPYQRDGVLLNIARGLGRLGEMAPSGRILRGLVDRYNEDEKMIGRISKAMEDLGLEPPVRKERGEKKMPVQRTEGPKNVLALYDTYEGGLKPVHLRAIARAGPLCHAFDLDLALMGFPTDDLEGLIDQVIKDTNIGRGGKYLKEMAEAGRIILVPCTEKEPPRDLERIGLPVATTSRPRKEKVVSMTDALALARSEHPGHKMCLIMGLGKRGLPSSLLKHVPYHLELTGRNIPLETSTAMGVIAEQLRSSLDGR